MPENEKEIVTDPAPFSPATMLVEYKILPQQLPNINLSFYLNTILYSSDDVAGGIGIVYHKSKDQDSYSYLKLWTDVGGDNNKDNKATTIIIIIKY